MTLKTELELLKKDVSDMKHIHSRLDTAITKLTDVSVSYTHLRAHET